MPSARQRALAQRGEGTRRQAVVDDAEHHVLDHAAVVVGTDPRGLRGADHARERVALELVAQPHRHAEGPFVERAHRLEVADRRRGALHLAERPVGDRDEGADRAVQRLDHCHHHPVRAAQVRLDQARAVGQRHVRALADELEARRLEAPMRVPGIS
jgi:hypothetical protein